MFKRHAKGRKQRLFYIYPEILTNFAIEEKWFALCFLVIIIGHTFVDLLSFLCKTNFTTWKFRLLSRLSNHIYLPTRIQILHSFFLRHVIWVRNGVTPTLYTTMVCVVMLHNLMSFEVIAVNVKKKSGVRRTLFLLFIPVAELQKYTCPKHFSSQQQKWSYAVRSCLARYAVKRAVC